MKWFKIFLVLALIGLIVIIWGVISTNTVVDLDPQKSYSDGSITFNYPENFEKVAPYTDTGDVNWFFAICLEDDTTRIDVDKYKVLNDPYTAMQEVDNSNPGDPYYKVLSHTKEVNPNGIVVFKSVNIVAQETNENLMNIDFYFKDKKDRVYSINISDDESKFQKVSYIANLIFNSLKLK